MKKEICSKIIFVGNVLTMIYNYSNVKIVPFTENCILQTFSWVQNPLLRHYFLIRGKPTYEKHLDYFHKILNDNTQKIFSILYYHKHVGNCGLKNIVNNKEAEIWIYIGEDIVKNKKVGTLATKLLINHCFNDLHLINIFLHVAEFNKIAIKMYKKLGFCEVFLSNNSEWKHNDVKVIKMGLSNNQYMSISMMQPTFLPWQGLFELIYKAEAFIFLDDFQFSSQSYHQRNRLMINDNNAGWYTVPINKKNSYKKPLNETIINESTPWRKKIWKRIKLNYSKTKYFHEVEPLIEKWLFSTYKSLADQNMTFIKNICEAFDWNINFIYSSSYPTIKKRSYKVLELLRHFKAKQYYCAHGSFMYMHEDNLFPVNDIEILFQNYIPKQYHQFFKNDFISNLSVLDALFNVGFDKTADLIVDGTKKWLSWQEMTSMYINK